MFIDALITVIVASLIGFFSRRARQQSKPDVSQELREQIVNIIDDLVDEIAPGYLLPNSYFPFDYKKAIYERIYKSLWDELDKRRVENVDYRDEIFEFLREVPSEKFFNVTEHLLKAAYRIVYIQITISDDIIPNPNAGNELWSRKESIRDRHIRCFKGAVDILNYRLSQNDAKYRYELGGGFVQMVRFDTGLDVPEENKGVQEPNDNQIPERYQNQSRIEFWNERSYRIAVAAVVVAILGVIVAILVLLFGDGILRPPL